MTWIILSDQLALQANNLSIRAICISILSAIISGILTILSRRHQEYLQKQWDHALLYRADLDPTACYIFNSDKEEFTLNVYKDSISPHMWHYNICKIEKSHDVIVEKPIIKTQWSFYTKIACIDHALKHSQWSPYTIKYKS